MVFEKKEEHRFLKLYLETSVWNFLSAPDSKEKMDITKNLFKKFILIELISFYISPFVLEEIFRSSYERRRLLESFIDRYGPFLLRPNLAFQILSEQYVQADILPERYHNDLFHIAMGTVHEMDAVVSWNLKHIVNKRTIDVTNTINIENGYGPIKIFTPQEVITYVSRTESDEGDTQDP